MTGGDKNPNSDEGTDPAEDVRHQTPGEKATANLAKGKDNKDGDQGVASRQGSRHADDDDARARGAETEAGWDANSPDS